MTPLQKPEDSAFLSKACKQYREGPGNITENGSEGMCVCLPSYLPGTVGGRTGDSIDVADLVALPQTQTAQPTAGFWNCRSNKYMITLFPTQAYFKFSDK